MHAELQYDLTRKQRLLPHIRVWGVTQIFVIIGLIGVGAAVMHGSWRIAPFVALLVLWGGRGYITGLINVILVKSHHMEIRIEDNGLEFMAGKDRWYIYLDGLTAIRNLEKTVWTIQHWNGTIVNIPKKDLTEDVLNFLRDCLRRIPGCRVREGNRSKFNAGIVAAIRCADLGWMSTGRHTCPTFGSTPGEVSGRVRP